MKWRKRNQEWSRCKRAKGAGFMPILTESDVEKFNGISQGIGSAVGYATPHAKTMLDVMRERRRAAALESGRAALTKI